MAVEAQLLKKHTATYPGTSDRLKVLKHNHTALVPFSNRLGPLVPDYVPQKRHSRELVAHRPGHLRVSRCGEGQTELPQGGRDSWGGGVLITRPFKSGGGLLFASLQGGKGLVLAKRTDIR